jgi:anthranilate phosphoribosyltransferase
MSDNTLPTAAPQEHAFAPYVRILGKGKSGSRSLSLDEARHAFSLILRSEVEPLQLGAFLMLLRVKEETAEEDLYSLAEMRWYARPLTWQQI